MKIVTDPRFVTGLKLSGYKPIRHCDMELGTLNLLLGANGAAKSNLIDFFRLIRAVIEERLQRHGVFLNPIESAFAHCGQKPWHGPLIAMDIGLEQIRGQCPHFDAWVTALEGMAA